jgi:hypothetical protein
MHFPTTLVISLLAITPVFAAPTPSTDSTGLAARDVGDQTLQKRQTGYDNGVSISL